MGEETDFENEKMSQDLELDEATCSSTDYGKESTSGPGSLSSFDSGHHLQSSDVPTSINDEPFYFESDTLALRNNTDYSSLLKTLILLEAQRIKACQDLEKLIDMKETALKDPIAFVNTIKSNDSKTMQLPTRQKVYVLPEIDWNKYYSCVDVDDLENIRNQNAGRTQSLRQTNKLIEGSITSSGRPVRTTQSSNLQRASNSKPSEPKGSANYNKAWSVEEQRTLEELLIEFPPEDNEAARWRKIATKLGTRTPLQVQSHCQKYFIKLAKAGLPIPGRMPNMKTYVTKRGGRGGGRKSVVAMGSGRGAIINQINSKRMVGRGSSLNEISSMWTSFNPPIVMNDDMDTENHSSMSALNSFKNFEDADEDEQDEQSQSVNNEEQQEEDQIGDQDDDDDDEIESINFNNANRYRGQPR